MAQAVSQGESREPNYLSEYNHMPLTRILYMHYGIGEKGMGPPMTNSNIYQLWRDPHNKPTAPVERFDNCSTGAFQEKEDAFWFTIKNQFAFTFSDLKISCDGNLVTLKGETKDEVPNEIGHSRMTRTFTVPDVYDMEKLQFFKSYDNYICIRVPTKDEYKRTPDLFQFK